MAIYSYLDNNDFFKDIAHRSIKTALYTQYTFLESSFIQYRYYYCNLALNYKRQSAFSINQI